MSNKLNGKRNVYDIIKKEKLDVVNKPITKAHGLPNECYNSTEYTKIERKKPILINFAWHIPKEINNYVRNKLKYKGKILNIISSGDFK